MFEAHCDYRGENFRQGGLLCCRFTVGILNELGLCGWHWGGCEMLVPGEFEPTETHTHWVIEMLGVSGISRLRSSRVSFTSSTRRPHLWQLSASIPNPTSTGAYFLATLSIPLKSLQIHTSPAESPSHSTPHPELSLTTST